MIVYVDLIFLLNFFIDGLLLLMTAWTRQIKVKFWRIAAAALIGASYVVMMFVPALSFAFTFMIKAFMSMVMVYTAYGFSSLNYYLKNLAAFYLINFSAAGCMFAVQYFLHSPHGVFNGMVFTQSGGLTHELKIGGLLVMVLLPMSLYLYYRVFAGKQRKALFSDCLVQTMISIDEHELTCVGLIDTGNQLYDPISRHPVIIMETALWAKLLPDTWVQAIQREDDDQLLQAISNSPERWQQRLRIIPFRGINKGAPFILALKPDKVVIEQQDHRNETNDVWIGLSGTKLCMDGSYQAIIHPAITNMSRR